MEAFNLFFNLLDSANKYELSMECVLKWGKPCTSRDSIDKITLDKWGKIQTSAKEWKGIDKFGDLWDTANWEDGQKGRFMYNSCYITLRSSKKREQAIIRDAKAREAANEILKSTSQPLIHSDSLRTSPLQKRIRLSAGLIHKKDQCLWCMKNEDKKHPDRPSSKLLRIEQSCRWQDFKRHVPFLKDANMRRRIIYLVVSTPDSFAAGILRHKSCWTFFAI